MASEDRSLSEFPRALEVLSDCLLMISNPDGLGGYDTNSALLTEVGRAILGVQYTQQLGNVSVFDAIKNTRVLSGTTTPTAIEGANGQLYVKYETVSNVDTVIGMYFKKDGAWLEISLGGGGNTDYIECTQAQYDTWEQGGTLDPDTLYFITDGNIGNDIIDDSTTSASKVWSSDKTDSEIQAVANAKQNTITSVSHSITPTASSTVSPFTFYGEYNFSSDIGNKTVLSVVVEGGGSNNAHTYSFVSKRVRIYANAGDELTVTLFLI